MRLHGMALLAVTFLAGLVQADDKTKETEHAKNIIGTWKLVKAEVVPPEATVEFTKDGKITIRAKMGEKELKIEGTYKIEGDKITTILSLSGMTQTETGTLKKLTDKELIIEDKEGKTESFEKVTTKKE